MDSEGPQQIQVDEGKTAFDKEGFTLPADDEEVIAPGDALEDRGAQDHHEQQDDPKNQGLDNQNEEAILQNQ